MVLCFAPPQLLNRVPARTSCTMMPPPPPVFLGQPEFIYDQHDVNIVRLVIRQTKPSDGCTRHNLLRESFFYLGVGNGGDDEATVVTVRNAYP